MVGATLAVALAKLNQELSTPLSIAVIEAATPEKKLAAGHDGRSVALSYGSQCIFNSLGLWEELAAQAVPINTIHVSDRGRFGVTRFHASKQNVSALGYVVPAQQINRVLTQAMSALSDVEVIAPAKLVALESDNKQQLTISHDQLSQQLSTRLLIGADGSLSTVRKLLNIETTHWDYQQQALVANIHLQRDHRNTAYERFTPSGPVALLPLPEQQAALVWTLPKAQIEEYMGLSDAQFLVRLQALFGYRLGRFMGVSRRMTYPLHMLKAKQQIRPGCLLIGNAAHTLHPIAAQGLNLGLRDVSTLVTLLREHCLHLPDSSLKSSALLLEKYNKQRRLDQYMTMGFTDLLVRVFLHQLLPVTLGRNIGLLAFDLLPQANHYLARQTMGLLGATPLKGEANVAA